MAVKIHNERMADIDPTDGKAVMYIEGTYENGDTLPTDHIFQGSWLMEITSKDTVKFYDADSKSWR